MNIFNSMNKYSLLCSSGTLDNELHAQRCIACDFSRTQAKLMDEFPTLGAAPKKKK
jgi:hypothetical protein